MSAVTSWQAEPAVVAPRRRHLQSVPTGADATRIGLRVPQQAADPARIGLRLTARGRRAATLLVAMVLLAGGGLTARALAAPSSGSVPTVVVQDGQTLSDVAHRAYPALQVSDAVAKVQLANGLSSSQVAAGQRLELPR